MKKRLQIFQRLVLLWGLMAIVPSMPTAVQAHPGVLMPFAEVIFPGFLLSVFGVASLQGPSYQLAKIGASSLDILKYKFLAGCSRPEDLSQCYDHAGRIASWYDRHLNANADNNLAANLRQLRWLIHQAVESESSTFMSDNRLADMVALIQADKRTFFDPDNIGYVPLDATVEEYFGTISNPNYFNLANVAYRIISECSLGTVNCEKAKMLAIH